MTWIKICGITTTSDALGAVDAGADALGFVFTESKRRVEPATARTIAGELRGRSSTSALGPGSVALVGVFTDEPLGLILEVGEAVGLDVIQLHTLRDEEEVKSIRDAGYRALQGARVRDATSFKRWLSPERAADAVLLDSWSNLGLGGTGERFDWGIFEGGGRDVLNGLRPAILAGGLSPSNVREALERLRPDGVDVSTGVEEAPGKKNAELMRQFVTEVRTYDGNSGRVDARRLA